MIFIKKGKIFEPNTENVWSRTHAQVPTYLKINESISRIFYSTRNNLNESCISYVDVDSNNMGKIIYEHDKPVLEKGALGAFDDAGVMPSSIVHFDKKLYLYYTGWMTRGTIPYHNSIGLAISNDMGRTFKRLYEGPIISSINTEPYFVGTCCVIREENIWKAWYSVCTKWEKINNNIEPFYHIKYAESEDGIIWKRNGQICVDYISPEEGGIVRASVIRDKSEYKMWFSYRKSHDYRTNKSNSYRIGFASSKNGINWIRNDANSGISISEAGWDSEMMCYPDVLMINNKIIMLYNGNSFGKYGFGYAENLMV